MTKPVRIDYANYIFAGFSTKIHLKKKSSRFPGSLVPWFPSRFFFLLVILHQPTCPRLCSSTRNVDCASSLRYCVILNRHAQGHFFWGADFKLRFKILIPTKTTRKAATMRFVVFPLVLGCIKGSYAGLFRGFNFNHVTLNFNGFY